MDRRLKPWRIPAVRRLGAWLLEHLSKLKRLWILPRLRLWLVEHLPAGLLARPGEWFLASLCCLSGLTILAGGAESTSVARLLPQGVYLAWGACLVTGGVALSCGLSSYRRSPGGWIVTRVACYRLGLRLLGLASGLYAFSMLWVAQLNAVPAASITTAFSGMCGVRLLTLGTRR